MNSFYKISIDRVNDNYISGWCFHRFRKSQSVQLALYCDNECFGEMIADQFREDLKALGVHPSGKCGFELVMNRPVGKGKGVLKLVDRSSNSSLLEIDCKTLLVKKNPSPLGFIKMLLSSLRKQEKTILFMHIPKTAGTSFNTQIRTMLPKEVSISHIEDSAEDLYPALKRKYCYVSGHLRYGIFKQNFCDDNTDLYTIVREPYAHLHSHIRWVVKSYSNSDMDMLKYKNRTIYDLVLKLRKIDFGNIDHLYEFSVDIQGVEAAFFDNMQTRHFLSKDVSRISSEDFLQAMDNTENFRYIGMTEHYDAFVKEFSKINNYNVPAGLGSLNRSRSKPLFDITDESVKKALHPLVCFDLLLYDHICNLYK